MQKETMSDINLSKQLYSLLKLGKEIAVNTNLDDILTLLGDTGRNIINADRCSIFIYDKDKNELWSKVSHGVDKINISADKGIVGNAALSQEVQIVVDAYDDFRFCKDIDKITGYVTKNIIAVPLLNFKNETIGVFQALNKKDGVFTNIDAELLILIGNYASVSLENALLYDKLKISQKKIINKLSEVAEFRDSETSAHANRVGLYCEIIAKELDLGKSFCYLIKLTAPMHDIGKIGIPDNILLKPDVLNEKEFETIKTHSLLGYKILIDEEDEILKMAATTSLDHHERYEGGGYPNGKSAEDISIEGRITAIADVFDSLTSKRSYKEAWSIKEAVEYIKNGSGKQFDPKIVDSFVKKLDDIIAVKNSIKD